MGFTSILIYIKTWWSLTPPFHPCHSTSSRQALNSLMAVYFLLHFPSPQSVGSFRLKACYPAVLGLSSLNDAICRLRATIRSALISKINRNYTIIYIGLIRFIIKETTATITGFWSFPSFDFRNNLGRYKCTTTTTGGSFYQHYG